MSDNGGPAYPVDELSQHQEGGVAQQHFGISVRDDFAKAALVGLIGRSWDVQNLTADALFETWATSAYKVADAMLKARFK